MIRLWADYRRVPWDLVILMAVAAAVRLVMLDLKAPHFDEGVNGWFADRMRETGTFRYTPDNFHGPWHFYTVFLFQELLGRNLWALRLPAVAASVLAVPVLFLFGRWFGRPAVRWAALAFAVSPAMVFYGRYSIHEPWFVLFLMLFTWGVIALWRDRDRAGLWAAATGFTGMVLNKETYIIHAVSLGLAGLVMAGWNRLSPLRPDEPRAAARGWTGRDLAAAAAVSAFLLVLFYSGNFFHPAGLLGPFEAMGAWVQTGTAGHGHEKSGHELLPHVNYYWLALLARYEWPALAGLLWSVRFAWPSPAVPRLLAIFAAGVLCAYSIVPYKTPWCLISITWPWFLFFGAAAAGAPQRWRHAVAALLLAVSAVQTVRLNFFRFENDAEPYVYVQTYRAMESFTGPLRDLAVRDPRTLHRRGGVYLESYYPLPWVLGDFTNIGYYPDGEIPDPLPEADFHVIETGRAEPLRAALGGDFTEVTFLLRSGVVECSAFFSRELADRMAQPSVRPARRGEP